MFILGCILVGSGLLFDIFELIKRCVSLARRRGDISATPLFGLLVSFAGLVILRIARLTLDSAILFGVGLFFLHMSMQALLPFLLRAPFNYFAGHKGGLFDPLSFSYPTTKVPMDTSAHDEQAKARKRTIHGP
jgi:hypothetical protein